MYKLTSEISNSIIDRLERSNFHIHKEYCTEKCLLKGQIIKYKNSKTLEYTNYGLVMEYSPLNSPYAIICPLVVDNGENVYNTSLSLGIISELDNTFETLPLIDKIQKINKIKIDQQYINNHEKKIISTLVIDKLIAIYNDFLMKLYFKTARVEHIPVC